MTYQFKIELADVNEPKVWRKVIVPADFTFEEFHFVIQISFGWEFSHLFFFSPKGYQSKPMIEMIDDDDEFFEMLDDDSMDAETTILSDIFIKEKQKFTYLYDFGDDWKHQITLEKIFKEDENEKPILINGEGACPPEDCGGPWGYHSLKEVLANKKHPDHKEMKEWLGLKPRENWDAAAFNLETFQELFNENFSEK